jgi:hypothetical protein
MALTLSSNNDAVTTPAAITVPGGALSASFTVSIAAVATTQTAIITATAGDIAVSFTLQFGVAIPNLTVNTTNLAFGAVNVNTAITQALTLSSTGNIPLTVSSVAAGGPGFTVATAGLPVTLNPGQTTTLFVQFDPLAVGPVVGQLVIGSNSSNASMTTVNMSGTGVPMLTALTCAVGSLSGAGTDSCTVVLNEAAGSSGFTVGLASNSAAVAVPETLTVAAGATTANFVADVSSVGSAQTATLTAIANGVAEIFALQLNGNPPALSVDASSVGFGNVPLNTAVTQTINLAATGLLPVTVTSVAVSGPGFSIAGSTFPLILASGQSAAIDVTFDPATMGIAMGQVTVVSTSLTNGAAVINLSGAGIASAYQVNLSWDAPSSSVDPVAGYLVFRSPSGAGSFQQMFGVVLDKTAYVDTNVQDGQSYDYIVESVDAAGVTSTPSNTATVAIP